MDASALMDLLIVVGLSFLGLVALLIWQSARAKQDKRTVNQAVLSDRLDTPEVYVDASAPQDAPEMKPISHPQSSSLLSIHRDWDNIWNIQVKGRRVNSLTEVMDASVRKNVIEAIKILAGLVRAYEQDGTLEVEASLPLPTVPTLPAADIFSSVQTTSASVSSGPIDLAKEIGDIVDRFLKADPHLRNHSLLLQNVPGGGIRFLFNGKIYSEIDEIPNEGVKAIIRKATEAWNQR